VRWSDGATRGGGGGGRAAHPSGKRGVDCRASEAAVYFGRVESCAVAFVLSYRTAREKCESGTQTEMEIIARCLCTLPLHDLALAISLSGTFTRRIAISMSHG
jgi:hypothetical protein